MIARSVETAPTGVIARIAGTAPTVENAPTVEIARSVETAPPVSNAPRPQKTARKALRHPLTVTKRERRADAADAAVAAGATRDGGAARAPGPGPAFGSASRLHAV